ncbi:MAG: CoA pyrophosphatase [Saprospiraceae bacterium]|nr:CoA pyrophosphatase [Saprospiraceae bacterium]
MPTILPGEQAHQEVSPPGRLDYQKPDNPRQAAVLIAIHPFEGNQHIILIERVTKKSDIHSGQISLPGGKFELDDLDLEQCALREAEEEVGLDPHLVQMVGPLSPLYIPVSNFEVFPFVGYCEEPLKLTPQYSEVAAIHRIALQDLLESDAKQKDHQVRPDVILPDIWHFDVGGLFVWGATAMILNELRWVLRP